MVSGYAGGVRDVMAEVRWFDHLGTCQCGKPAIGILRGSRNEDRGKACMRCAERRLAESDRARHAELKTKRLRA